MTATIVVIASVAQGSRSSQQLLYGTLRALHKALGLLCRGCARQEGSGLGWGAVCPPALNASQWHQILWDLFLDFSLSPSGSPAKVCGVNALFGLRLAATCPRQHSSQE